MSRIKNGILCIISCAGVILALDWFLQGLQPCSGDGCMIHIIFIPAIILIAIAGPIFYTTLKQEIAWRKERKEAGKED
jgi:hypothetical protein